MYDNITCFVPNSDVSTDRLCLDQAGRGWAKNMRLRMRQDGLVISGSLGKYLSGYNYLDLTREGVKEALSDFEKHSGQSLKKAIVWKLETGLTLPVQYPSFLYLASWTVLTDRYMDLRARKHGVLETVTYYNRSREFAGYDKEHEVKANDGIDIGYHALRLEFRVKLGMKKIYGQSKSPWELTELDAYRTQANLWKKCYSGISKQQMLFLDVEELTLKKLERILAFEGAKSLGEEALNTMINCWLTRNPRNRTTIYRMQKYIKDLLQDPQVSRRDDFTAELDEKVNTALQQVA